MSTPAAASKPSPKSAKKSRLITLHLSRDQLSAFPSDSPPSKSSSSAPSVKDSDPTPSLQQPEVTPAPQTSESNATPVPSAAQEQDPNSLAPPKPKRKGGWPAGRKRAPPSIDPNAPPRERGRPGPKKKPRLPDGTIDRSGENGVAPKIANPIPAHKLGPKANTGAINAGLRALDRSGKPCRRWEKKGLHLKSFTGMTWGMTSWRAPQRDETPRDETKSDSTGSSEVAGPKPNQSSVMASEDRSRSGLDAGGDHIMSNGLESSPAPAIAA